MVHFENKGIVSESQRLMRLPEVVLRTGADSLSRFSSGIACLGDLLHLNLRKVKMYRYPLCFSARCVLYFHAMHRFGKIIHHKQI